MTNGDHGGEEVGGGVADVKQRRADCGARGPLTERRYKTEWRCGGTERVGVVVIKRSICLLE